MRGIYFDSWHPLPETSRERKQEELLAHVRAGLQGMGPINLEQAARTVSKVLARHVSEGERRKVRQALPHQVRALWPEQAPAEA